MPGPAASRQRQGAQGLRPLTLRSLAESEYLCLHLPSDPPGPAQSQTNVQQQITGGGGRSAWGAGIKDISQTSAAPTDCISGPQVAN